MMRAWPQLFVSWVRVHQLEVLLTGVAFAVYCAFSGPMLVHQSQAPHFVYQAFAFDHGRLSLPGEPPNLNDWVLWNGRWYVSFPPFPAVLMMPFVALHGVAFNDVFFTVCIAALNVGLFAYVLKVFRAFGEHARSDAQIAALSLFFAFGTVYFYSSIRGEVWFTAHVVGVTLTLVYLLASLRARWPLVAGLALGCAAITRANLAFAFPFFLLEALAPEGRLPPAREWPARLRTALPRLALFGLAGAAVLGLAMWMNYERFGRPTEFGHALLYANRVNARVRQYGLFNLRYLPGNFRSAFLLLPSVSLHPLRVSFDGNGMSMLVTTPLLALVPFAVVRARSTLALAVTAAIVALPGLLYMNNGWYQFGFRFSNDYLPYLFLLLAVGGRPMNRLFFVLGALGIAVSAWGAVVFNRP